jgi:transposase-like protein
MSRYSNELKQQLVRKMMPPHNRSVASISQETGISAPTLYAWKHHFQEQGQVIPKRAGKPDSWDGKARLAAIIKTALMNESERSVWCREHGVYAEQLDEWKLGFESADDAPVSRQALAKERHQRRALEKELHRKEKALAEAAALLTLSKKAQAIWGTDEED